MVGGQRTDSDSYRLAAHRFTVLVPGTLDPDQRDVVSSIIEAHKPAHTICEVCEARSGMRVGSRLHVELTSYVGPGAGWAPAVVGKGAAGRGRRGRHAVGRLAAGRDPGGSGAGRMSTLVVDRLSAVSPPGLEGRTQSLLTGVARRRLGDVLRGRPLPEGDWYLRRVDVPLGSTRPGPTPRSRRPGPSRSSTRCRRRCAAGPRASCTTGTAPMRWSTWWPRWLPATSSGPGRGSAPGWSRAPASPGRIAPRRSSPGGGPPRRP